ncbi:Glycolipid transfer protein-like [Homarus americanus]|uniref:Glycolipid transfer protein-like n=1 Tax=Homarus americanus TaxID=6706 RepID=A0A8J5N8T4_HOMAM|nr:Glycolipid transfer protein-like [Homarus americanus]
MSEDNPPHFFSQLSPLYPKPTEDGKINTVQFLEASKSFIQIYDLMGTTFYVVKKDMSGNIEVKQTVNICGLSINDSFNPFQKLYKTYNKASEKYKYLNDLIYEERNDPSLFAVDALLWLKRALEFTVAFVNGICEEHEKGKKSERIDHLATEAYNQTLKPYHMWLVQNLFKVVVKSISYRSDLVKSLYMGKVGSEDVLYAGCSAYIKHLETNLKIIVQMYDEWGLNNDKKV